VVGFQQIINGKYKLRILWDLHSGPRRYGEIRQRQELRSPPLRVQYALTSEGRTLIPVIAVMHKWGVEHLVRRSILRKMGILPGESD
jgi:DNA-binding HxlR family transcriptional regulator